MIHRGRQSSQQAFGHYRASEAPKGSLIRVEFPGFSRASCGGTFCGITLVGYLVVKEATSGALFGLNKSNFCRRAKERIGERAARFQAV